MALRFDNPRNSLELTLTFDFSGGSPRVDALDHTTLDVVPLIGSNSLWRIIPQQKFDSVYLQIATIAAPSGLRLGVAGESIVSPQARCELAFSPKHDDMEFQVTAHARNAEASVTLAIGPKSASRPFTKPIITLPPTPPNPPTEGPSGISPVINLTLPKPHVLTAELLLELLEDPNRRDQMITLLRRVQQPNSDPERLEDDLRDLLRTRREPFDPLRPPRR